MEFEIFGLSHILVFVFIILTSIVIILMLRNGVVTLNNTKNFLIVISIATYFFFYISKFVLGWLDLKTDLPMHLCDWAFILSIICLIKPKQIFFELAYFWGLGGTLQALLTPEVNSNFPDISFFIFFSLHSMIIINIIFLVFGLKLRPYPSSIVRVFLISQIYFITALCVNLLLNSNYGYIMSKPETASLLDFLGPHPWYLISLQFVALLSFLIYYIPFYIKDKFSKKIV